MTERMSPVGSIMWGLGQDASMRMIVGNVMILDRPPTCEALIERLTIASAVSPRLRQRPDASPGIRSRPAWIDDEFDAGQHVRTMAVASPETSARFSTWSRCSSRRRSTRICRRGTSP